MLDPKIASLVNIFIENSFLISPKVITTLSPTSKPFLLLSASEKAISPDSKITSSPLSSSNFPYFFGCA